MTHLRYHSGYFLLLLSLFVLQGVHAQKSKVIELRHADKMEGRPLNGEDLRELIGNVHLVQPTDDGGLVKVWCDRALRYMKQNKIELFGHVKVMQDSVTIYSSEGVYYGNQRMMEGKKDVRLERGKTVLTSLYGQRFADEKRSYFRGNVVLIDTNSTITCDELRYMDTETKSIATGNVHVFENANGANIYGDSLVHIEKTKFTNVLKRPRLVRVDTTSDGVIDTMVVISRTMRSYQDSTKRFIAIDSVRMVKGTLSSRCGKATFLIQQDQIVLQSQPIIWSENNQITGDSIRILMVDKRIRTLWVKRHAMAISLADSTRPVRQNQLTGRDLTMYFRENKLQQVDVQKNATSLYYLYDNQLPNGVNRSSGDRIFIDFLRGEADRIKVVGGVQGQYFPEKMILKHESDYNLDGFRLYTNRPIRRGENIANN